MQDDRLFTAPETIPGQLAMDTDALTVSPCPDCKGKGKLAQWGDMSRAVTCSRCSGAGREWIRA